MKVKNLLANRNFETFSQLFLVKKLVFFFINVFVFFFNGSKKSKKKKNRSVF